MLLLGDFWQFRPPGQIAITSNPFAPKVCESANAQEAVRMFWNPAVPWALQEWNHKDRALHLHVNEWSGADI